jgi:hypothetical protein
MKQIIKDIVCGILFFIVVMGSTALAGVITLRILILFIFLPINKVVIGIVLVIVWIVLFIPLYKMYLNLELWWRRKWRLK